MFFINFSLFINYILCIIIILINNLFGSDLESVKSNKTSEEQYMENLEPILLFTSFLEGHMEKIFISKEENKKYLLDNYYGSEDIFDRKNVEFLDNMYGLWEELLKNMNDFQSTLRHFSEDELTMLKEIIGSYNNCYGRVNYEDQKISIDQSIMYRIIVTKILFMINYGDILIDDYNSMIQKFCDFLSRGINKFMQKYNDNLICSSLLQQQVSGQEFYKKKTAEYTNLIIDQIRIFCCFFNYKSVHYWLRKEKIRKFLLNFIINRCKKEKFLSESLSPIYLKWLSEIKLFDEAKNENDNIITKRISEEAKNYLNPSVGTIEAEEKLDEICFLSFLCNSKKISEKFPTEGELSIYRKHFIGSRLEKINPNQENKEIVYYGLNTRFNRSENTNTKLCLKDKSSKSTSKIITYTEKKSITGKKSIQMLFLPIILSVFSLYCFKKQYINSYY